MGDASAARVDRQCTRPLPAQSVGILCRVVYASTTSATGSKTLRACAHQNTQCTIGEAQLASPDALFAIFSGWLSGTRVCFLHARRPGSPARILFFFSCTLVPLGSHNHAHPRRITNDITTLRSFV